MVFFKNIHYSVWGKLSDVGITFVVYRFYDASILDLRNDCIDLISNMVIGKVSQQLMLYFFVKLTNFKKLNQIFFVITQSRSGCLFG